MSLGFENAGFDVILGVDNWGRAIDVYRSNFGHPALELDLSNVELALNALAEYDADMIIGGPPCQDFSSAGKRDENNGRGDLTVSYAKIVSAKSPEWFVMENVDRILKTEKLKDAKKIFKNAGYGLSEYVLDASLCGVPQKRKRYVLVGKKGASNGFMLPYIEGKLSSKPMTVAEYFGNSLGIQYYYRHPRSYVRRGIFSVNEPSPTIRGVNRPIPAGYKIHKGDPVKSLDGIRPLTTEERWRIQTFPENFKFSGTKTEIEQMIGNAVPVNLGTFIGASILSYLNDIGKGFSFQNAIGFDEGENIVL